MFSRPVRPPPSGGSTSLTPTKLLIGQILIVFAIVIAGVWASTQWVAAELAYQPELGAPWFIAFGEPVYRPWQLFSWWYHFDAYAPQVFDRAGMLAGASGFVGCGAAVAGSLWRARVSANVTTYGSASVHDIKGENWTLTAGWRARFSHCLLCNPTDARSAHYNPLLEVRRGPDEVRDVQNIADILVDPEGALERRNHWEKTSHSLLVGAILHVLSAEEDKTLARVATFLSDPQRSFAATLRRMMATNHRGPPAAPLVQPVVASAARELLNKRENERSGVLSTAMSFLGLYRAPTVAEVPSRCDWRIAELVEGARPVSLYLVIPPSDISRTKPLFRLVLNQIGRRLTVLLDGGAARHGVLLMLD